MLLGTLAMFTACSIECPILHVLADAFKDIYMEAKIMFFLLQIY